MNEQQERGPSAHNMDAMDKTSHVMQLYAAYDAGTGACTGGDGKPDALGALDAGALDFETLDEAMAFAVAQVPRAQKPKTLADLLAAGLNVGKKKK